MIGNQQTQPATTNIEANIRAFIEFMSEQAVTIAMLASIAEGAYREDPVVQEQVAKGEELERDLKAWFEANEQDRYMDVEDQDNAVIMALLTATTMVVKTLPITVTGLPGKVKGAGHIVRGLYYSWTFSDRGKEEAGYKLLMILNEAMDALVTRDLTPEETEIRDRGASNLDTLISGQEKLTGFMEKNDNQFGSKANLN